MQLVILAVHVDHVQEIRCIIFDSIQISNHVITRDNLPYLNLFQRFDQPFPAFVCVISKQKVCQNRSKVQIYSTWILLSCLPKSQTVWQLLMITMGCLFTFNKYGRNIQFSQTTSRKVTWCIRDFEIQTLWDPNNACTHSLLYFLWVLFESSTHTLKKFSIYE